MILNLAEKDGSPPILPMEPELATGKLIKYHPQCGTYVCTSHTTHRYLGITGLEVTLVWFPGKGAKNIPDYNINI